MSSPQERAAVEKILRGIDGPVIVELGAHVGEEAEWLSRLDPSIYVMVEPDMENALKISKRWPNYILFPSAISYGTGACEFFPSYNQKSDNRASGSTRKPTGHLEHFPEVTFFMPGITVGCVSLDDLCEKVHLGAIDILWCDIQGAERDMIAGGKNALAHTRFMMIEAEPEVELYEGQALKPELLAMLHDWEVIEDFGYNLLMRNKAYV